MQLHLVLKARRWRRGRGVDQDHQWERKLLLERVRLRNVIYIVQITV